LMSQKLTRGRCECHRFAHAEGIADVAYVVGDMDSTDVVDRREDHAANGTALKLRWKGPAIDLKCMLLLLQRCCNVIKVG
jgi:hypothetical protein